MSVWMRCRVPSFLDDLLLTISYCYKVLHGYNNKRVGKMGHFMLKLDMSKSYDRVEWSFIDKMMLEMGFSRKWVDFIGHCIRTITLNGVMGKEFFSERGLRQGDPLNPYLFLIFSEGLSSLMKLAIRDRCLLAHPLVEEGR